MAAGAVRDREGGAEASRVGGALIPDGRAVVFGHGGIGISAIAALARGEAELGRAVRDALRESVRPLDADRRQNVEIGSVLELQCAGRLTAHLQAPDEA